MSEQADTEHLDPASPAARRLFKEVVEGGRVSKNTVPLRELRGGDTEELPRITERIGPEGRNRHRVLRKLGGSAAAALAVFAGLAGFNKVHPSETPPPAVSGPTRVGPDQIPSHDPASANDARERIVKLVGPVENEKVDFFADSALTWLGKSILKDQLHPDVEAVDLRKIVRGKKIVGDELNLYLSDDTSKPDITFKADSTSGLHSLIEGDISFYLDRNGQLSTAETAADAPLMAPSILAGLFRPNFIPTDSWVSQSNGSIAGTHEITLPNGREHPITVTVDPDGKVVIKAGGNLAHLIKDLQKYPAGS
jgi:hypothetical protein